MGAKKSTLIFLAFCFFFLISICNVHALNNENVGIEVNINSDYKKTKSGGSVVFNVEVRNNQELADDLIFSVAGPHLEWMIPSIIMLHIEPNSAKKTKLTFNPIGDEDSYRYIITFSSRTNPKIIVHKEITIEIAPPVIINNMFLNKAGDEIRIDTELKSFEKEEITLFFEIKDRKGTVKYFNIEAQTEEGLSNVSQVIHTKDLLAGTYTVEIRLKGTTQTISRDFEVEPFHDVIVKTEKISNPFYDEILIIIYNSGNIVERDYTVSQNIPSDFMTGFVTKPNVCYNEDKNKTCNFLVSRLEPRDSVTITYMIEYWPSMIEAGIVVAIVIIIVLFSFSKATKPKIKKRSIRKSIDKHSVILEIKNPFLHNLRNVIIRDWISPLAKVAHDGFEPLKPVMRKSEAGTELIWRLSDMKPKEVRIISYKIKTFVEGSLKMPRAHLRFKDKKGKKIKIHSKSLVVR